MDFNVGDLVGDYRVIGALGAGGMGTVYKVQHVISDRVEALKVLLPDLQGNSHLAERFLREIKLQAALSHPGIASLLNAFRLENRLLMVMEYVEGESLDRVMRRGRIDVWSGVELIQQVLSALGYAHGQGVIHRDIKPANIMLTPRGTIKLMDFGIARPTSDRNLTQTGTALGSLYYMSPEQVRGGHADLRSDIYSVGVTLYEIVTGVRPIQGDSSYSVMNAHLEQTPRSPDMLNQHIPVVLGLAIMRALQKEPADRYQDATEFRAMLEDLRRRHSGSTSQAAPAWKDTVLAPQHAAAQANPSLEPPISQTPPTPTPVAAQAQKTGVSGPQSSRAVIFDPDGLDRVKKQLASHIGPVAKLLVDRTAKKASSWRQLYEMLAQEVPAGAEREKFLASRHR